MSFLFKGGRRAALLCALLCSAAGFSVTGCGGGGDDGSDLPPVGEGGGEGDVGADPSVAPDMEGAPADGEGGVGGDPAGGADPAGTP